MSFVLTKGTEDEYATKFAYVACAYVCIASENQPSVSVTYHVKSDTQTKFSWRDVRAHLSRHSLASGKVIQHLELINFIIFSMIIQHAPESTSSEYSIQWSTWRN